MLPLVTPPISVIPIPAMILAAGLGTRLAPLSSWRAKSLVPIGDAPAIAAIVARVSAASRAIVVNAHHRAEDVEAYARQAGLLVSREDELLGTGGGLARAWGLLGGDDVLVWNGDMDGDLDVGRLLEAHARNAAAGVLATLVVRPRDDAAGNVGLDPGGDVVRLRRESARGGESGSADFLGIYVVSSALRSALPVAGDIIAEAFLPSLRAGGRILAFLCDAPFLDVGTPGAYLDANLRWLGRRGLAAWTGDGAHVAPGVTLDRVVVGAGARVLGGGRVERCVLWPGAEARAPLADTIVALEGAVHVRTNGS